MWRALSILVGALLLTGVYALVTGGPAHAAAPAPGGAAPSRFGFALAAGSVALFAAIMMSRSRSRMRR